MSTRTAPRTRCRYSAQEKCRAVLAVWTGQRRASQLSRELKLPAGRLAVWQRQALEGMLKALEPKRRTDSPTGPMLEGKIAKLWTRVLASRQATLPVEAPEPPTNPAAPEKGG